MSNEIKIPGPPVGYTDLLDYEITAKLEKDKIDYKSGKKKQYFPLRPSAAGYCARRLAYNLMDYYGYADFDLPVNEPNVFRLFELGHSIEWSILNQFRIVDLISVKYKQEALTCFELEATKIEPKRIIEGSCDACFFSDKYKCIADIKSVKDRFSRAFNTYWIETLDKLSNMATVVKLSETAFYVADPIAFLDELGEDFLSENIVQLNLYACTPFMKERGVDHAVIYKYNKNDSRHYELRFSPSQQLADMVEKKFNAIAKAVAKKKPEDVPRDFTLGTMHCGFCPYNQTCWPEEDAKKEYFHTFPKKKWPTDIARIKNEALGPLFNRYENLSKEQGSLKDLELQIINILHNNKINKIKLDNGHVYQVKLLKSPKKHYELRRTKL